MVNILFIHQSAELYGSDKTLLLLLKKLNRDKFFPVVVVPNNGPLVTELNNINIKVIISPVLKLSRSMFAFKNIIQFYKDLKTSFKILDNLHSNYHFDLVYSNTLAVLLGLVFSNKRKIKHIWHVHEIIVHPKIIATIFPILLNKFANVVVCNSVATSNNLIFRNKKLTNKTTIFYNGLEIIESQNIKSQKEDFGFKKEVIVITLVGRISRLKGHKWLINTFINHFENFENLKILFVGSPVLGQEVYLEDLKSLIKTNDLSQKVKILDFTPNLNEIWNITDIAVMPSTEAESFGLVALEAMLAQKPVVGSNHGGLKEIIIDNETGFLVEPNNEVELSKALKKLIQNPETRKFFGQNGHKRAITEFSIETHVTKFENLFEKMVNQN